MSLLVIVVVAIRQTLKVENINDKIERNKKDAIIVEYIKKMKKGEKVQIAIRIFDKKVYMKFF